MKSRENLVNRALQKLRVLGAGQTASAEDYKVVDDVVEPVLSELSTRSVYGYGNPDKIEDDAFEHLATCVAQATAPDFGLEPDEGLRLMAETRLREISAQTLSYQPARTEYF